MHKGILGRAEIQCLASQIRAETEDALGNPSSIGGDEDHVDFMTCAATLAYRGWIRDLDNIWLQEIDLGTVPIQHLISLLSSVKRTVNISYEAWTS